MGNYTRWNLLFSTALLTGSSMTACSSTLDVPGPQMIISDEETHARWYISVSDTRQDETGTCLSSPAVAESWESPNPSVPGLDIVLVPDATEADATRISQCLRNTCPEKRIIVTRLG